MTTVICCRTGRDWPGGDGMKCDDCPHNEMTKAEFLVWWHAGCDRGRVPMEERNENVAWLNYQQHGMNGFPFHIFDAQPDE